MNEFATLRNAVASCREALASFTAKDRKDCPEAAPKLAQAIELGEHSLERMEDFAAYLADAARGGRLAADLLFPDEDDRRELLEFAELCDAAARELKR
jgi:hypothetical protein